MRIVITDSNLIWNINNPYLKKYKEIVLVVCLYGKKITDEFECFVSPYNYMEACEGMDNYGVEDQTFKALASVANKLNYELNYHDDIVFLTDVTPGSLYPYYILKDIIEYNKMHLITMPPLYYERQASKVAHRKLLEDLTKLDSLLYYDINKSLFEIGENIDLMDFVNLVIYELGDLLPHIMNGIYHMKKSPCYFDFSSLSYIPLEKGFDGIDISKKIKMSTELDFKLLKDFCTLGLIIPPEYPNDEDYTKHEVERPVARLDGKRICNILRNQRLKLAEANSIPFKSDECPSIGPCAGTCEKCDREAIYLRKEMNKIPEEKRIYPEFDPIEEVTK